MTEQEKEIRRLQREVSLLQSERDLLQAELDALNERLYDEEQEESMWDDDFFSEELFTD